MIVIATLLWKLQAVKELVRPLFKKQCLRIPLTVNMLKSSKFFKNLDQTNLITFISHSERV